MRKTLYSSSNKQGSCVGSSISDPPLTRWVCEKSDAHPCASYSFCLIWFFGLGTQSLPKIFLKTRRNPPFFLSLSSLFFLSEDLSGTFEATTAGF